MVFHTIYVSPGLNDRDRALAHATGPPHVAASASYTDLLVLAGFEEIEEVDLTDQYRVTAAAWLHESTLAAEQLEQIFGLEEFQRAVQERKEALTAIERGLLRRSLFAAQAGGQPPPLPPSPMRQPTL